MDYNRQNICYICKKEFDKKIIKQEIIVIIQENIEVLPIIFVT